MSNNTRTVLDNYLEQISPKQMRVLFRNPRKVHLITELYYGNITIQVEKKYQTSFEQLISDAKWPIKLSLDAHNNFEYTFKHNDVPFACRMERIHRFNGWPISHFDRSGEISKWTSRRCSERDFSTTLGERLLDYARSDIGVARSDTLIVISTEAEKSQSDKWPTKTWL